MITKGVQEDICYIDHWTPKDLLQCRRQELQCSVSAKTEIQLEDSTRIEFTVYRYVLIEKVLVLPTQQWKKSRLYSNLYYIVHYFIQYGGACIVQ